MLLKADTRFISLNESEYIPEGETEKVKTYAIAVEDTDGFGARGQIAQLGIDKDLIARLNLTNDGVQADLYKKHVSITLKYALFGNRIGLTVVDLQRITAPKAPIANNTKKEDNTPNM